MKSIRIDPELEERFQRAAAIKGESLSEFIRQAATRRAAEILAPENTSDFDDVLGVVHGGGGRARRTGDVFAEILTHPTPRR